MSVRLRLALVVALQTLALFAMVGMKQWTLATGTPILLETEPIDPRSLFRGDYVRLTYAISGLDHAALPGDEGFERHETIYVLLREDEPYWQPVSLHRDPPEVPPGHIAIKGKVTYIRAIYNQETKKWEEGKVTNVRYGIENYFVPEGEGLDLERPAEGEIVSILVAVDLSGKAGIKAVLVNGVTRHEEGLF